MTDSRINFNI